MDDQSYTLPSSEFPKLPTENRSYSSAQIAELRKAAKSRGVTIIPEIEMPDEMTAIGYRVINASWKPMYMAPEFMGGWEARNLFDVLDWSVYDWNHWWEKSNSTLNPTHVPPTDKIIGGQLCFWELTYEREVAEVVKRLAALSQRSWSVKKTCTNKEFEDNLNEQIPKAFALIARTTV